MKSILLSISILLITLSVFGQTKIVIHKTNGQNDTLATTEINKISFIVAETVTDFDGNIYHTVQIGTQLWTVENLRTTKYNDGTDITKITTDNTGWTTTTSGAYCAHVNDENNVNSYGYLYNWHAVNTGKLAPAGWRVPSDADWTTLEKYLGMSESEAIGTGWRGTDEGGKLKETGISHWQSPNSGATNSSGFSALPGGSRDGNDGAFNPLGDAGSWWSSSAYGSASAWNRGMYYGLSSIIRFSNPQRCGFSVRLVRDL